MKETYSWLEKYFKYNKSFKEVLNDEKATAFLLIWPIFEQKIFGGFLRANDISNKVQKLKVNYSEYCFDETVEYFHDRYQDNTKKRNLTHSKEYEFFNKILATNYKDLSDEQKLELAIFVVFRYRNNIFHGNKGIISWSKYSKEIKHCIKIMTKILDYASNDEEPDENIKV